jgi:hypothetical protein
VLTEEKQDNGQKRGGRFITAAILIAVVVAVFVATIVKRM